MRLVQQDRNRFNKIGTGSTRSNWFDKTVRPGFRIEWVGSK